MMRARSCRCSRLRHHAAPRRSRTGSREGGPRRRARREGSRPGRPPAPRARAATSTRQQPAYTESMLVAGLLSLLVPGVGQLYRGATRRGLVLLGITLCIMVGGLLLGSWVSLDALSGVDRSIVTAILAVDLALLAFRVFAVVDAVQGAVPLLVAALVALTAAPHVAAAWVTVRSYDVLESVFADEEPCGTACDRGSVLLATRRPAAADLGAEGRVGVGARRAARTGRGRAARGRRARARGHEAARRRGRGRRSCCSAPTRAPATSAPGRTRSSSRPSSTTRAAPPRSASRATSPRCRSARRGGCRRSR